MPFTPFHFGPGLLVKGLAPESFSASAYCATQVLIDCETAYHLMTHSWPLHGTLHTFVGGAAAGLFVALGTAAVGRHIKVCQDLAERPIGRSEFQPMPCFVAGMFGGLLHVLLDGIMHSDTHPLRPFVEANPFLARIDLGWLHLLLIVAGLVGLPLLLRGKLWRLAG